MGLALFILQAIECEKASYDFFLEERNSAIR